MKKSDVSLRTVACRAVLALGCFVFSQLVGAPNARAESARKVEGFEALGTLGYGVGVGDLVYREKELAPYGVTLGLELGYTLPFGLRIGADVRHGFGRRLEQTLSTGEVAVTDVESTAYTGSIGYDLLLSSFRVRGAADAGLIFFAGQGLPAGASWGIGPSLALIWQYRAFALGLESKYWLTSIDGPGNSGLFQVGLLSGARF